MTKNRGPITATLCGAMALSAFVAASSPAFAEGPSPAPQPSASAAATMEVVVLHAKNDGSGIDPKIGPMPELAKPPFSSYSGYKLLGRDSLALRKGQPSTLKLPNGRDLMVTWKDDLAKPGEPKKYVINASIQKGDGKVFLPLLSVNAKAGEVVFVAGQTHEGGILVIGLKVVN